MDRTGKIILFVAILLLLSWGIVVDRIYPRPQTPASGTNEVSAALGTNGLGQSGFPAGTPGEDPSSVPNLRSADPASLPAVNSTADALPQEEFLILENEFSRYHFTTYGGGLREVELKKHLAHPGCSDKAEDGTPKDERLVTMNLRAPSPFMTYPTNTSWLGAEPFRLRQDGPSKVIAEKDLSYGLRVVNEYELSEPYLIKVRSRLENTTQQPIQVPESSWVIGTAATAGSNEEPYYLKSQWYDGKRVNSVGDSFFSNRTLGCIPGTPRSLFELKDSEVQWISAESQFFAMIAVTPTNKVFSGLSSVPVQGVGYKPLSDHTTERTKTTQGFETHGLLDARLLAPGESWVGEWEFYCGPKEYKTLSKLSSRWENRLDKVMGFGMLGIFSEALLLGMNGLNSFGFSYGWSIVVITVLIKLVFWPLTKASTKSMKRMAKLQPQMKAIQEKYKEDPTKMNQKMMEFMRENKVNPLGGCIPMLLQIPVFMGFFFMIRSAVELRGASFLWACDLSQPDTVWVIPGILFPLNIFPILMGTTQFFQMRLTPPSPGMDPMQQKIIQYMPMIFLVILYNFSSGLTLYWTVQNLLSIIQTKLTKNDPEETPGKTTVKLDAPVAPTWKVSGKNAKKGKGKD